MTSSIPLSLPETIVPSGAPVAAPGLPPGGGSFLPDFAGLLDAPVTGAASAPIPPALAAPVMPAAAADIIPVETPWVGIPAGVPAAPLAFAGGARRFTPVPGSGRAERAGEAPAVPENTASDETVTPTRAEQEEAMAMLSALFPVPPSTPPMAFVSATTEAVPAVPVISDALPQPAMPALGREGQIGWSDQPAPAVSTKMNRTDRSDEAIASATFGAPEAPAQPTVRAVHREANPPQDAVPRVSWSDAPETARPQIRFAAAAAPAPLHAAIESAAPELAGAAAVEPPAPTEQPAEIAAAPAPECTVIEASVVRPDGVRLARRTAAGAVRTPDPVRGQEKSAGEAAFKVTLPAGEKSSAGKKVLSASGQQLAENEPDDGTTAANGRANMNPLSPLADAPAQRPGAEMKLAEAVSIPSGHPAAHEAATLAAPRVISTVLEVVEAQEASKLRPVPAVHLRMQVAGETVGIKVELRDNTVQTHFTTVSPELREALTREWQAARAGTPGGATRLPDPVFNSNPDRGGSASHGQDAASQQQQQARAWGSAWQQSASSSARRSRPSAAPESPPAAVEALDARLLSAVA